MTHTISIINQKGGVGKTTSALNIASFLAKLGVKTLLLDLDPQGNSSDTLLPDIDLRNKKTTFDFFFDSMKKQQLEFKDYIQTADFDLMDETIDVMPANIKLAEIEINLAQEFSREKILQRAFKHFSDDISSYDFIIIDCPPSLGLLTINSFVFSKYLLVPVDASAYSHQGLLELVESLAQTNITFECNTELIGIFFSKFAARENVYQESYQYLKSETKGRLFETVIRKSTQIEQAPHFNKTILDYAPNSNAFEDYYQLTLEISLGKSFVSTIHLINFVIW